MLTLLLGTGRFVTSSTGSITRRVSFVARLRPQVTRQGGLLVIVDEFGKFLEYAALHPETEDLLVMQQLAEAAARSPTPILLLTILHTSFAEYLHTADQTQRMEW